MNSRCPALTLTVPHCAGPRTPAPARTPARSPAQPRFAFARSTEPEVFTFEHELVRATAARSCVPVRPRKRCTRVMYPAKVRMHLPPPEKSRAKRWLLALCLVVLWQIYTEDPGLDPPAGSDPPMGSDLHMGSDPPIGSDLPATSSDCPAFAFPAAAAEPAQPCTELSARADGPGERALEPPRDAALEQSAAGKSYVVALLVYHRLGNDN
ncbi:radiation-inducible immediate-early gene IEX-1 [Menidia menidia]